MNNELIKVAVSENGQQLVSARELHGFLEVKSNFTTWVSRMLTYGFTDGVDYTLSKIGNLENTGFGGLGTPKTDYIITIDMAKEISMIQRTAKGKMARQYFIECEKKLKVTESKAMLLLEIYKGGQAGIIASRELSKLEVIEATTPLLNKIEEDKPLVDFTRTVIKSSDNILIRELAKIAYDEGINIGERKLYKKLREWKMIFPTSTEPYQKYVNNGYFVVEEKPFKTPYGEKLGRTTKVTGLGQVKIISKLKSELQADR